MAKVRVNPLKPTKISEGGCSIYTSNLTQLITLTDSTGNVLLSTYANSSIPVASDGAVFARSNSEEVDVIVNPLSPENTVEGLVVGTQEEIDAVKDRRADTLYVVTTHTEKKALKAYIGNQLVWEQSIPDEPTPEEPLPVVPTDQGLAKDYPGTGWYKATDTGVVYNKDVLEGETHTFEGDLVEYISVWRNEGLNLETFTGSPEDIQNLLEWYKNLNRYATSNVTDMSNWMFGYGDSFGLGEMGVSPDDIITDPVDVSHYDTSSVTNMSGVFGGAVTFNQPLDNFDTSNVTDMSYMFNGATSFNQPLDSFITSNVTNMTSMFADAQAFNQPLDNFDTSNVTNMEGMFARADSFKQDVSHWDTSNVTDIEYMYTGRVHEM